jgi:hypothetical protein
MINPETEFGQNYRMNKIYSESGFLDRITGWAGTRGETDLNKNLRKSIVFYAAD